MARGLSIAVVVAAALGLLLVAQSARADGLIIVDPPVNPPPDYLILPYLPVKYHRVTVEIEDQVAQVEVDQAFVNDSEVPLEATYVFPLPEDAAISDFSLLVDGEVLEGRILDMAYGGGDVPAQSYFTAFSVELVPVPLTRGEA